MITGFAAEFGMPGATFEVLATNGTDPCRAFLVEGRTPKTSYSPETRPVFSTRTARSSSTFQLGDDAEVALCTARRCSRRNDEPGFTSPVSAATRVPRPPHRLESSSAGGFRPT